MPRKLWEHILDQIVTCNTPKGIPTLAELREHGLNAQDCYQVTLLTPQLNCNCIY